MSMIHLCLWKIKRMYFWRKSYQLEDKLIIYFIYMQYFFFFINTYLKFYLCNSLKYVCRKWHLRKKCYLKNDIYENIHIESITNVIYYIVKYSNNFSSYSYYCWIKCWIHWLCSQISSSSRFLIHINSNIDTANTNNTINN